MRDRNGIDGADLDRWITGNYGEDQFRLGDDEEEQEQDCPHGRSVEEFCEVCDPVPARVEERP